MFKSLALASIFLVAVHAGLYVLPHEEIPAGRTFECTDGCYLSQFDTVIPADVASYPSPTCESFLCSSEAGYITFVSTCPSYYFDDPTCALVPGDGDIFPNCCATVSCTNPDAAIASVA